MKRSTITFSAGAVALLAALAACSSDSTSSANAADTAEMNTSSQQDAGEGAADMVGQLAAGETQTGSGYRLVGGPSVNADVAGTTVTCTGPDGSGWYTCNADLENGLTVVRQVRFWQGTSNGLWWNTSLTDSVNHRWTAIGAFTPAADTGRLVTVADSNAGTMTVIRPSGGAASIIVSQQHSWTGAGAVHRTATWTGANDVPRTLVHTGSDSVSAVLFQMPRSINIYPLSGSIVLNVQNHFTAGTFSRTVTRRYVVTFNGTNVATLQDGGLTCDLSLDMPHTVTNCH